MKELSLVFSQPIYNGGAKYVPDLYWVLRGQAERGACEDARQKKSSGSRRVGR